MFKYSDNVQIVITRMKIIFFSRRWIYHRFIIQKQLSLRIGSFNIGESFLFLDYQYILLLCHLSRLIKT